MDYSSIVGIASWLLVVNGVLQIFAAAAAVYVAYRGALFIRDAISGTSDDSSDSHEAVVVEVDFLCSCGWHGDAIDCQHDQNDDGDMKLCCPDCGTGLSE